MKKLLQKNSEKGLNEKGSNYKFMDRTERRILYAFVGFLGGALLISRFTSNDWIIIIGAIICGFIGERLAVS